VSLLIELRLNGLHRKQRTPELDNRILDAGWSYDNAGNIVKNVGNQTIAYDAENRQVAFCTSDPTERSQGQSLGNALGNALLGMLLECFLKGAHPKSGRRQRFNSIRAFSRLTSD
jgi:hypothetical protein